MDKKIMRLFVITATALALAASVARAGLVEVTTSTYYRESGNPTTEFLEVTLENAGEIRVSNVNLQGDAIEPTAATEVLLDGSLLMQPFTLPTGGSSVFPLTNGHHTLQVSLAGKPGGGIKVSFYEEKPDAPEQGKGWELLEDNTVLHRKTGLIWHRNSASPGLWPIYGRHAYNAISTDAAAGWGQITISQYISNLNAGVYGEDPIFGNAGKTDWRAPTAEEFFATLDYRVSSPPLEDKNGNVDNGREIEQDGYVKGGYRSGMQVGDPIFGCENNGDGYWGLEDCPEPYYVNQWITNSFTGSWYVPGDLWGYLSFPMEPNQGTAIPYNRTGSVWPVRGSLDN